MVGGAKDQNEWKGGSVGKNKQLKNERLNGAEHFCLHSPNLSFVNLFRPLLHPLSEDSFIN